MCESSPDKISGYFQAGKGRSCDREDRAGTYSVWETEDGRDQRGITGGKVEGGEGGDGGEGGEEESNLLYQSDEALVSTMPVV